LLYYGSHMTTVRNLKGDVDKRAYHKLYLAMREAGMTNVQLARKLGCDEKEVRRMLDPRHPTKLPMIKEALDVFGQRLVVSVEEAA
jgi:hypothetical protein